MQQMSRSERDTYSDLHALLGDLLLAAHHVLLHLHELGQLLGQVGPEGTAGIAAQACPVYRVSLVSCVLLGEKNLVLPVACYSPKLPFPKMRPALVDEEGGGGSTKSS